MQTDRPVAVMYHQGCADGFGAAWAVWRSDTDAEFRAVEHDRRLPEFTPDTSIYMLDFAPTRPIALEMSQRHGTDGLAILDHHISAQRAIGDLPTCHIDLTRSGAVIAWHEFNPTTPVPELLLYVQDRDLWKWELPDSREISAYLHAQGFDFHRWNRVHNALQRKNSRQKIVQTGRMLVALEERVIKVAVARSAIGTVAGYRVPIANSQVSRSEIGQRMLDQNAAAPFAAIWYDIGRHRRKWSLRSRGDFDVSLIATRMGGGGHASAASFTERIDAPRDPCRELHEKRSAAAC